MKFGTGTYQLTDLQGNVLAEGKCEGFTMVLNEVRENYDRLEVEPEQPSGLGRFAVCIDGAHMSAAAAIAQSKVMEINAVTTADFYDKLINHPKMQKAKRRQITKAQGAQWKRERRGFRP